MIAREWPIWNIVTSSFVEPFKIQIINPLFFVVEQMMDLVEETDCSEQYSGAFTAFSLLLLCFLSSE